MIVVRPEPARDLRVGQVIAYTIPVDGRQLETHRVIRILHGGQNPVVQTQGDANNWRDPWTAKLHGGTVWRLGGVVPYAGYGVQFLRSPLMHRAAIFVAPGLIALIVLAQIWGFSPRKRKPASLGDSATITTGLSTQPR
jgi:signal peptidase